MANLMGDVLLFKKMFFKFIRDRQFHWWSEQHVRPKFICLLLVYSFMQPFSVKVDLSCRVIIT